MNDLSIGILAYKHEAVLADLVRSILNQETSYTYNIIIGVDLCDDNSLGIAKFFKNEYPNIIDLIEHSQNIGGNGNLLSVAKKLSGRFSMIVDGDDIFLPGKIQKVCDILSSNPEVNLVAHHMVLANSSINKFYGLDKPRLPDKFSMEFMVANYLAFGNSQKAYRSPINLLDNGNMIDFSIDIRHVGHHGLIAFINEPLGIKRNHHNSITDAKGPALKILIDASLLGFDEAYVILKSKKILKAKVRYLVAAISGLIKSNEKDLVKHYLYELNTLDIKGFKLFELFKLFRYIPMLQVTCIRIMQILSSIRKTKANHSDFSHLINKK